MCHIGETHGIYTIVGLLDEKDKYNHYVYKWRCNVCGFERIGTYYDLSTKKRIVYTCKHLDICGNRVKQVSWKNDRLRHTFNGMRRRCYNKADGAYRWYGEKGIRISQEWIDNPASFENWAMQNGYTDDMTIDRIDPNGDYCPENCRWITRIDNSKYKSTTSIIDVDGQKNTGRGWAVDLGLSVNAINKYVREYGMENTVEFIRQYIKRGDVVRVNGQSLYRAYMKDA